MDVPTAMRPPSHAGRGRRSMCQVLNTRDRRRHHEPERAFHLASELSQRSGFARNIPGDRARKGSPIFAEKPFQDVGP
jgi:hypothetical protein